MAKRESEKEKNKTDAHDGLHIIINLIGIEAARTEMKWIGDCGHGTLCTFTSQVSDLPNNTGDPKFQKAMKPRSTKSMRSLALTSPRPQRLGRA